MRCLERLNSRVLPSVVGTTVALLSLGGAAQAAPSDRVPRPPGAIENRGYELVNVPAKNQQSIQFAQFTHEGNRGIYGLGGGSILSQTGTQGMGQVDRTSTGWSTRSILPPRDQMLGSFYGVGAFNTDFTQLFVQARDGGGSTFGPPTFARLSADGTQTPGYAFPDSSTDVDQVVATDDLRHVFLNQATPIDSGHQPETNNIYDFGGATPELVNLMSDGSVPECGVSDNPTSGFAHSSLRSTRRQNWMSRDGSVVFFVSRGDDCGGRAQLFRRDRTAATTTQISSGITGSTDKGVDTLLQAAADGSWVIYRTATQYDLTDTDTTVDVYRYTVGSGNSCLSCVASVDAIARTGTTAGAASVDGERVYFSSGSVLAPGAIARQQNIYLLHNGTLEFVAIATAGFANNSIGTGALSTDGRFAFFRSSHASLNASSGSDNGGTVQWYRYDADARAVTCVSCPATGAPNNSVWVETLYGDAAITTASQVTADGGTFFFLSFDPLVRADVNSGLDIYEWHDGELGLITDGKLDRGPSNVPMIVNVTPSGRDFFFIDYGSLGIDGQETVQNVYDARIDGGFPNPVNAPGGCSGDQCQGPLENPPVLGPVGSKDVNAPDPADDADPVLAPDPKVTVAKLTAKQQRAFARKGVVVLSAKTNGAGTVRAVATAKLGKRTRTVANASKTSLRATNAKLTLRLTAAAKRQLKRGGKLKTTIVVSFSGASSKRMTLVLKAPAPAKRR